MSGYQFFLLILKTDKNKNLFQLRLQHLFTIKLAQSSNCSYMANGKAANSPDSWVTYRTPYGTVYPLDCGPYHVGILVKWLPLENNLEFCNKNIPMLEPHLIRFRVPYFYFSPVVLCDCVIYIHTQSWLHAIVIYWWGVTINWYSLKTKPVM